ncbi:sigma-54 dependent transcriptional regulator [Klebsiella michiganensis]|uniref:Sigma-54 dependent transcriptional regulator n=1 Tax=Klebsiella michiganensis TaxID=1134687 RepID=A0A7H4PG22_9ENTR|nr:sigma-54 dependent transcriptional regulator [Klebsiella michiganensis]
MSEIKYSKKEAFKDIYPSIINELDIKEQAIDINGQSIYISIRHFSNRQTSYSIITGLNQESSLWQNSISKKSKLRGFSTTWSFDDIIGQSPAIRDVIKKAKLCARHELPIHILGDTGTGKELFRSEYS